MVSVVLAAVATFLDVETDWANCKKIMADPAKFEAALNGYDKDNVPANIL